MEDKESGNKTVNEIKDYVSLEVNYAKLLLVEKLSELFSMIAIVAIVAVMCAGVIFYASFALVSYLSEILCSDVLAYLSVSMIIVLVLILLLVMRKRLIVNPIARFLSKLFLKAPKGDNFNQR